jgi:hypothetical protein
MYLARYTTGSVETAILIPGSPCNRLHINVDHQTWDAIASAHFAVNPDDTEICLVTDIYVTSKVAFDYKNSTEEIHYIVNVQNTQTGEIPSDFQIRSNSPTLLTLQGAQYVFLESHLRKGRVELKQRKLHWRAMITHGPHSDFSDIL